MVCADTHTLAPSTTATRADFRGREDEAETDFREMSSHCTCCNGEHFFGTLGVVLLPWYILLAAETAVPDTLCMISEVRD